MRNSLNVLMLCLCTGMLVGCEDRTPPTPEPQAIRPAKLHLVTDARQTIKREFVGKVEALHVVDISFEVAGPLVELPILEGQEIAAGELLAALDPRDFELAVKEAEVQVKLAAQDLQRKQQVLAQQGIARSVVDDARSVYELQVVRLEKAKEQLADSRIVAPFNAFVSERYVDNHVNVERGKRIARLLDLNRILVVGNVPEALLATGDEEQLVGIYAEFDFIPGQRFALDLYENKAEADAVAQTYEVSFIMDRPQAWNILPGMSATIHVEFRDPTTDQRTFVPADAIVTAPDQSLFVWVYDAETQRVSKRSVQVGPPESSGVPILNGLVGGEQIVTTGSSQLQEGMKIRPFGQSST